MVNEIKVGDYIRTKDGIIGIFKEIDEHCRHYGERLEDKIYIVNTEKNEYLRLTENDIVKHSPNIIDLIECGDYVNGEQITDIWNGNRISSVKSNFNEEDIETVVTKEMMESISYKVKTD